MYNDTRDMAAGGAVEVRKSSQADTPRLANGAILLLDEHLSHSNGGLFRKYLGARTVLVVEELEPGVADRRLYQHACREGMTGIVSRDRAMKDPRKDLTCFVLEKAAQAVTRAARRSNGLKRFFNEEAASLPVLIHIPANHTNELLEQCLRQNWGDVAGYLTNRSAPVVRLNERSVQPMITYKEMIDRFGSARPLYDMDGSVDMRGRAGQARKPKDRDRESRQIDPQPNNARSVSGYQNFIAAIHGR